MSGLHAQTPSAASVDVTELSLEDLLHVRVTSASRKEESLFGASAAIYSISGQDIHRSGALDLPDAIRLAPGVQVGRIDEGDIALSPRGFNDISANKLLALIDGRSIYSPLFGGVQWRKHDIVMEDIERIEVIRGPGATLWGANAVNGVINVTTKSAHDTIGSLVSLKFGDQLERGATLRHGFSIDGRTDARVHAQMLRRAHLSAPDGIDGEPLDTYVSGFRLDHRTRADTAITVLGNWSSSRTHVEGTAYAIVPPYLTTYHVRLRHDAGHLLGRARHVFRDGTELTLQTYLDHVDAHSRTMDEESFLADFEATLHRAVGERHDVVAGLGARHTRDEILGTENYNFLDARTNRSLFTTFIQDEIALVPRRLSLTVGSKFEHNDYTGWETQPGIRFAWREEQRWTWWSSVARAVRTPARAERGTIISPRIIPPSPLNPLPTVVRISASNFDREELLAWESGLRLQLHPTLSLDLAIYRNDYDGLRSIEPRGTSVVFTPVPHVVYSSASGNGLRGNTRGAEVLLSWHPLTTWHLQASWATIDYGLELAPGSLDQTSLAGIPGSTPRHEFKLFSRLDLSATWSLDAFAWHHTEMRAVDIPAYTGLNLRLAWRPRPTWEIQLIGQDVLDSQHPEFPPTYLGGPTEEVRRSIRLEVSWKH